MNAKDVRDLSDKQLAEHVANARKETFGLRFQHATGELQNTASMRTAKRELARALTVQREREMNTTPNLTK